jgi:hypothetical protein
VINAATRRVVRHRAGERCEYCGLPQSQSPLAALQIEHILPRKHGGTDQADNLALACIDCNLHKGSNIAGLDPLTQSVTSLFDPRRQSWGEHFEWIGIEIRGKTDVGRTTVSVLAMNNEERVQLRLAVATE